MKSLVVKKEFYIDAEEREIPKAEPGMVVIKVAYASICGSDYLIWSGGPYLGLVPGHEFSGTIVDASDSDFKVGDAVCAIEMNPCGECFYCKNGMPNLCPTQMNDSPGISREGGYAEYVKVRTDMVRKLPENDTLLLGAICEPLSVSLHGCKQAGIKPGDRVLVWAAGPIGIYAAASAKALGASYVGIVEINPNRIELAKSYDFIDEVFDFNDENLVEKLNAAEPDGFRTIIETCGKQEAIDKAIEVIRCDGCLTLLGLKSLDIHLSAMVFLSKQIHLLTSWFFTIEDYDEALKILYDRKINLEQTITKKIALENVQDMLVDLTSGSTKEIKVVIDPTL